MEAKKHTPGPWRTEIFEALNPIGNVLTESGSLICEVNWDRVDEEIHPDRVSANALLISTAPELLKLALHIRAMKDDAHFLEHPEWLEIAQEAEVVIQKATAY